MEKHTDPFLLHHLHPIYKFIALFIIGAIVFMLLPAKMDLVSRLMIGWDTFSFLSVMLYVLIFRYTTIASIRKKAKEDDSSNIIIFFVVLIATLASLLAVVILITSKDRDHKPIHVISAVLGMVFSWLLVHALFAVRYAHLFYKDDDEDPATDGSGLLFPGNEAPDFSDFAYFSYVIGMTFQVSDIEISAQVIRRLVLLHAMISFAFNTVIVALTINVVAGLG